MKGKSLGQLFASRVSTNEQKIAEFFVFVDFNLYYSKSDSPHGGVFKIWGIFAIKQLKGVGLFGGGGLFVRKQLEGGRLKVGDLRRLNRVFTVFASFRKINVYFHPL